MIPRTVRHPLVASAYLALVSLLATSVTVLVGLSGCSRALPTQPTQAVLYRDLDRLVSVSEAAGWRIDRHEIDELLPEVLLSVCQVPLEDAHALELWLDRRIHELGGPVDVAYQQRKRKLAKVKKLLRVVRIRDALRAALSSAADDCPFWLHSDERFAGRQISDDRWQVTIGGGGNGHLVRHGDIDDVQFGGVGRALIGRNIGSRVSIYTGLELGGSASVPKSDNGNRTSLLLSVDVIAPVVVRYRLVNTYLELEAGYLARATEDDWDRVNGGLHLGISAGARAARVRWFFPGAVFGVAYDRVQDGGVLRHAIKLGFRVAFDIDLWRRGR